VISQHPRLAPALPPKPVMKAPEFYRMVMEAAPDRGRQGAKSGSAAVFHALRDRLTPEEGDQVAAQLSRPLQAVWESGPRAGRRPLKIHRTEFYERVMEEAGLPSIKEARWTTLAVFGALKEALTPGEAEDVLAQLPKDLKEVWAEAQTEERR
jgi:uncharacterized protein (DUF2267 family)